MRNALSHCCVTHSVGGLACQIAVAVDAIAVQYVLDEQRNL